MLEDKTPKVESADERMLNTRNGAIEVSTWLENTNTLQVESLRYQKTLRHYKGIFETIAREENVYK